MIDTINFLGEFIRIDIFNGYALFSVVFVISSFFINNKFWLEKVHDSSNKILIWGGLVYFVPILIWLADTVCDAEFIRRLHKYWFYAWFQPAFWVLLTQLLWFKRIAKSRIMRLIISFFLVVSFEMYVLIISSLRRDYLPSSWNVAEKDLHIFNFELLFHAFLKISLFCLYCYIYYFISKKIMQIRSGRELIRKLE
jgi:hypothetical protein